MPGVYAKLKKIKTPSYRIFSYCFNEKKQEEIIEKGGIQDKQFWKELEEYERANPKTKGGNNEALEIMLTLPNDLKNKPQELTQIVEEYIDRIGIKDHPYTYAIHGKSKGSDTDNLHCHIVFSERRVNLDREPKVYARDIWYDKTQNKLSKKGVGEIIHHKGEIQKDKEGNIIYKNEPFTIKDKRFKEQKFIFDKNKIARDIFQEHGYKNYQARFNNDIRLKQYHLPKYLKEKNPSKYTEIKNLNQAIKNYNNTAAKVLATDKNLKPQLVESKKNIISFIKEKPSTMKLIFFISKAITKIQKLIEPIIKPKEKPMTNVSSRNTFVQNSPRKPLDLRQAQAEADRINKERLLNDIESVLGEYNNNDIDSFIPSRNKGNDGPEL